MLNATAPWIVAMMVLAEPKSPRRADFDRIAEANARISNESPLFAGDDGPLKTAALIASVEWFESRFTIDAAGDCPEKTRWGTCAPGSTPVSFGLGQLHRSNFAMLGVTREAITSDVDVATKAIHTMLRKSFAVCHARPVDERLAWYAGGGPTCPDNADATRKSVHRWRKAVWLLGKVPRPVQVAPGDAFTARGAP